MKIIKVKAKPRFSLCKKQYWAANETARIVLYLTRRDYLDEDDLYILIKLGFRVEVTQNNGEYYVR